MINAINVLVIQLIYNFIYEGKKFLYFFDINVKMLYTVILFYLYLIKLFILGIGMRQNNINLAIEHYSILSETQKQILKVLVNFNQAVPVDVITKLTGLSKQAFHFAAKKLLEQNIISREKTRVFVYRVNSSKITEIMDFYNQQILFQKV